MFKKLNTRRGGFTLVEIMIVVAIIALLAAIAVPGFLRARKRSQASRILNDLRMIDAAVDQYAIETNRSTNFAVGIVDRNQTNKRQARLRNKQDVEQTEQESRGLHPRGNHDRRCDHRALGRDRGARIPPRP